MTNSKSGLEGTTAARTAISDVDGEQGRLIYQGIDIFELAESSTFEETTYLIRNGKLPNAEQLGSLNARLSKNRRPPREVVDLISGLPKDAAPMDTLRTAVSAMGLYDPDTGDESREANTRKAVRLVAQTPTLVAYIERLRNGQEIVEPREDFPLAANFLYMLTGEEPTPESAEEFDAALVLHVDHELNASAFTSRVISATLADMYSAVTGAIGALSGPSHGGANKRVMEMLAEIGEPENAEDYVKNALGRGERIMGFGHRVYRVMDPRAKILKGMSRNLGGRTGNTKWFEISEIVEDTVIREKNIFPNVDFYSASFYHELGIATDLFPAIFAMSRMSGWTAHVLEQQADNRLIRPRAEYTGPRDAAYVPLGDRS
ncbi:citrate synthase [soil metagenome]